MKKKFKILILGSLLLMSCGCTKYVKDDNKQIVKYEKTGQTLTSNILCQPTEEDLYNIYLENNDKLSTKLEDLPKCEDFVPTDIKYQGLWETFFVKPLAWIILKVGSLVKNYGIAVMLISIIIRLVLLPMTKKTMSQSENMKKAGPELARIEKKYANRNDNDAIMAKSQETMMVYKKYNINPLSSCLVSFIQLPLLFAFLEAINRVPAIFEGTLWNMNLGMTPTVGLSQGNYIYLALLLVTLGTTFLSFRISMQQTPNNDTANQMKPMMTFMLVMIGIASLSLPTALGLYWIVNNIFALAQNSIIKKLNERR